MTYRPFALIFFIKFVIVYMWQSSINRDNMKSVGQFYKSRGRRMVDAAKSLYCEPYNDDKPKISSQALSDASSVVDDSYNDPNFQPFESDENQNSDAGSYVSTSSEQSIEIPQIKQITCYTNETKNSGHEKVQNWLDEHQNIDVNDTTYTDAASTSGQVRAESVFNLLHPEVLQERYQNVFTASTKRWKKKKTFCKLCTLEVTNFERHLERQHQDSKKVQEFLKYPKKSKERRQMIGLLRNEGHFEEFLRGTVRPVYQTRNNSNEKYPCANCKGLFSKKFLFRHQKKCCAAGISKDSRKIKSLSASQTLIACALDSNNALHKLRIKEEVFNIMRADEIALVVKTDALIYHFGEQYLKKHSRKQMAVVCSNKMRELGRLLLEFRRLKNDENCKLIDVIDPVMFDMVIECAKNIGGYDSKQKTYRAPSVSAHIGTSLKQVSDLLIRLIVKRDPSIKFTDPESKLKEVKRFRELISSQWTTEISSLAFKNLNEIKWQKPTMLPLTKDILKFKNYVVQVANQSAAVLQENPSSKQDFKKLVDATLALTILYNRRRIGDVQYTKLQTYLNYFSSQNQEEFLNSLSESEKQLTKHYKRIVTGGKGSKPIVILFPQTLQDFMNVIISVRQSTDLVPQNNPYLFAHPNSDRWARGDVAIRKFADKAKLEHPKQISSNKLRKQIATVMQILNMNQEETEQFAHFMGHTEKTHNEYYRLPQDVYQTAKISKLLILMDKGVGHKYKGKSLNEIDINPDVDLAESDDYEDEAPLVNGLAEASVSNVMPESPQPSTSGNVKLSCKQFGRTAWTLDQVAVVKEHFKLHIKLKKAPKKQECEDLIKKHPHLMRNKDWVRVKTYVYNSYRDKK